MQEIKAIETKYKGYRFRSRMEAKWALFFDLCKIKWEYEPSGYNLGDNIKYLPDFYLIFGDGKKVFAEVKFPGGDMSKPWYFSARTHNPIILLEGNPELTRYRFFDGASGDEEYEYDPEIHLSDPEYYFGPVVHEGQMSISIFDYLYIPWWDVAASFTQRAYTQFFLYNKNLIGSDSLEIGEGFHFADRIDDGYRVVENATEKAKSSRFEFGEKP